MALDLTLVLVQLASEADEHDGKAEALEEAERLEERILAQFHAGYSAGIRLAVQTLRASLGDEE